MFFLLSLCCCAYEPKHVTQENFTSVLKTMPVSFVMASQEDSRFCQDLLPKFKAAADMMKGQCEFVIFDWDGKSKEILEELRIFAFPSIFVYRYGKQTVEYPGERDPVSMCRYVKRIIGDDIVELKTSQDVSNFLENNKISVILAGEDDILNNLKYVAHELKDRVPFGFVTNEDAINELGINEVPSLKVYRSVDRMNVEYPLAFTTTNDKLLKWVSDNIIPRYQEKDSITFRNLFFDGRYTILSFVDTTKKSSMNSLHKTMENIVNEFKQNFTYVYCDIYEMGNLALSLGFSGVHEPLYSIVKLNDERISEKYIFSERKLQTKKNINKWINDIINKTKPKSEKEIKGQKGPLYKLVGTTFINAIIGQHYDKVCLILKGKKEDKDYSLNIFNETANDFLNQNVNSVKFYYIDLDLNDIHAFKKQNWTSPIYLLYPENSNGSALAIDGKLNKLQLIKQILTNSKTNYRFKIPEKYELGELEL